MKFPDPSFKVLDLASSGRAKFGYKNFSKSKSIFLKAMNLHAENSQYFVHVKKDPLSYDKLKLTKKLPNGDYIYTATDAIDKQIFVSVVSADITKYLNVEPPFYNHIHFHLMDNRRLTPKNLISILSNISRLLVKDGIFFFSFDSLLFDPQSFFMHLKKFNHKSILNFIHKTLVNEGMDLIFNQFNPYCFYKEDLDIVIDKETDILYMHTDDSDKISNQFGFYNLDLFNVGDFLHLFSNYRSFSNPAHTLTRNTYMPAENPLFMMAKKL